MSHSPVKMSPVSDVLPECLLSYVECKLNAYTNPFNTLMTRLNSGPKHDSQVIYEACQRPIQRFDDWRLTPSIPGDHETGDQ